MNEEGRIKKMELSGGCVCGGTRYVLRSIPFSLGYCHCIDCRRSAGAPYVTWGSVPREDLRITKGEPRKIAHANRIRSFAACCGTHLLTHAFRFVENVVFLVGEKNIRSQKAMEKIGALRSGIVTRTYGSHPPALNVKYVIKKPR